MFSFESVGEYCSVLTGHQHIRMYDLSSANPNPVINYDGVSKNVTGVGFQEEGKWMYTGGEDCSARIWDLRYCTLCCAAEYVNVLTMFKTKENHSRSFKNTKFV